ncbi:MAG: TonB-dependent receptor [Proteobacteria bacterium]|nr:TonB-dependent receptor [Pseudomonadota bacterium]
MKKTYLWISILSALAINTAALANDNRNIEKLDDVEVIEQQQNREMTVQLLPEKAQSIIDTPDILKKMAGANVNRNGPLTGLAQYRGLSGARVNVQINGSNMQESCSNSMDAAMSHVPASMVDAVILKRGVAPISTGIETIGGSIFVIPKNIKGNSDELEFGGEASLGFTSANSGKKASVLLFAQSAVHNFYFGAETENGDSFDFNGGTNYSTEYDRDFYLLGYNFTGKKQTFAFKYNYNDTGETGTPSLPMDIVYAQGGVANIEHTYSFSDDWKLTSEFSHQNTDHLMSNYLFRDAQSRRDSFTQVNSNSFAFVFDYRIDLGQLSFGVEGDSTNHQANVTNPDNAMFHIGNFDTQKDRRSLFAELLTDLSDSLKLSSGVRYTQVEMDAADVSSTMAMMDTPMGQMHRMLRDNFNASDRNVTDNNIDLSFNLTQKLNDTFSLEYGLGYKTRSPSYQERYLWLPLEATAGMADGFKYLGNIDLNPEKATQFELGMTYDNDQFRFAPHIFYHRINDYIQGTPTQNPEVLKFNNVDAELYGADLELSYQISDRMAINNVTSYVKGQRRDIDDYLYRIAPFNTRFELTYTMSNWNFSGELIAYQAQDDVSVTNREQTTPGYGITNLAGTYSFNDKANIAFGVNNVFDKKYYNHLNGYNRNNRNTDVGFDPTNPRASRLPGEGVNIYATLYLHW